MTGGLGAWAESAGACAGPPKAHLTQPCLLNGGGAIVNVASVHALLPGLTRTRLAGALLESEHRKKWEDTIPMARPAEPSAMAGGVLYLVSGVSRYRTGVALHVNGGFLIT